MLAGLYVCRSREISVPEMLCVCEVLPVLAREGGDT